MNKLLQLVLILVMFISGTIEVSAVGGQEVTGNLTTGMSGSNVQGTVIVSPSASPAAGTYSGNKSVTLTATGANSIRYTTDNSIPTCSTGSLYSGAIEVVESQTIKAISCYANDNFSSVSSFAYSIRRSSGGGGGGGSVTSTNTGEVLGEATMSTKQFIELLIQIGVIAPDKVFLVRIIFGLI